ncbi:MAG: 3-dehydroquinate synthase [Candidatus Dadabacteria bacterium]|nr:3-dehydroquinate synthase [Candidatus Dadabacteria bacterium]
MERIRVKLKKTEDKSYEIIIGEDILKKIPQFLKKEKSAYVYVIITDSNVTSLYGQELLKVFKNSGLNSHLIAFHAGEAHKSRDTKAWIEDEMSKLKIGRDSCIIALGGGVVGDMAGFVAATYNRGLPCIQAPTTLVSSVDSSIGGKTGVDTPYGKNLIGTFYQPWRVYIDVSTLRTLHEKEIREGLAEIIKYSVIKDEKLFEYLEKNIEHVFSFTTKVLIHIIRRCCEIKGEVVELDEKESNLRKILNFGHTIGHAIENASNYTISHGEAISIGMVIEGEIGVELGFWNKLEFKKLLALLKRARLPVKLHKPLDITRIIDTMKLDKKARRGKIEVVLPKKIGEMAQVNGSYGIRIEEELIRRVLKL